MNTRTYSRSYATGWAPLLLLLLAPIVIFTGVPGQQMASVILLAGLGYLALRLAERTRPRSPAVQLPPHVAARLHGHAVAMFSVLSIVGCQLVLRQQQAFLGDASFENLQERYIALIESSLQGDATSSIWSSIGNLSRAFFFVAITSFVATSAQPRSLVSKLMLGAVLLVALAENFLVSVSRLQFIFFLVCGWITAILIGHPMLRRKTPLMAIAAAVAIFLVVTTSQRLDLKFEDSGLAEDYMTQFFGVELLPLGRVLLDQLGVAVFALCMYITQGVPELIRLITQNDSPYSLGGHSLFLVLSPLLRPFGVQLGADNVPITNQGFWWGLMGDLYLDFGLLFPAAFVALVFAMARVALRYGDGPVYGLALRALTAGMLFITPYIGALNTYAVSYLLIVVLAVREHRRLKCRRATAPHRPLVPPPLSSTP